jgi:hypothetical protein
MSKDGVLRLLALFVAAWPHAEVAPARPPAGVLNALCCILMCTLQQEAAKLGVELPPWRSRSAMLTKWLPPRYSDTVFAPPPPPPVRGRQLHPLLRVCLTPDGCAASDHAPSPSSVAAPLSSDASEACSGQLPSAQGVALTAVMCTGSSHAGSGTAKNASAPPRVMVLGFGKPAATQPMDVPAMSNSLAALHSVQSATGYRACPAAARTDPGPARPLSALSSQLAAAARTNMAQMAPAVYRAASGAPADAQPPWPQGEPRTLLSQLTAAREALKDVPVSHASRRSGGSPNAPPAGGVAVVPHSAALVDASDVADGALESGEFMLRRPLQQQASSTQRAPGLGSFGGSGSLHPLLRQAGAEQQRPCSVIRSRPVAVPVAGALVRQC